MESPSTQQGALASARDGGIEYDLVEAVAADAMSGDAALQHLARAFPAPFEPLVVRLRLEAEDVALLEALAASAQEDLLAAPPPQPAHVGEDPFAAPLPPAPITTSYASACACGGGGCVRCLGEGCPGRDARRALRALRALVRSSARASAHLHSAVIA